VHVFVVIGSMCLRQAVCSCSIATVSESYMCLLCLLWVWWCVLSVRNSHHSGSSTDIVHSPHVIRSLRVSVLRSMVCTSLSWQWRWCSLVESRWWLVT